MWTSIGTAGWVFLAALALGWLCSMAGALTLSLSGISALRRLADFTLPLCRAAQLLLGVALLAGALALVAASPAWLSGHVLACCGAGLLLSVGLTHERASPTKVDVVADWLLAWGAVAGSAAALASVWMGR